MTQTSTSGRARVIDALGHDLSPCEAGRARALVAAGRATLVAENPLTIQLPYAVERPTGKPQPGEPRVAPGTPLLLHICCGPCATYPVPHLRALGFAVHGWWYNPNIQPGAEYARREESARAYAARVDLPLGGGPYEPQAYERAVRGHEERPARCRLCYRLRLEETAREAERLGIGTFTTTLLVSPYQDQAALREIGEDLARQHSLCFFFENMRRGWAERGRLARDYGLYRQRYCGCRFSLGESSMARRRGNPSTGGSRTAPAPLHCGGHGDPSGRAEGDARWGAPQVGNPRGPCATVHGVRRRHEQRERAHERQATLPGEEV